MGLDAGSREVLLDLIYRLSLDDKASDGEARAPGDGAAKERRGKERSGDDGDDEARRLRARAKDARREDREREKKEKVLHKALKEDRRAELRDKVPGGAGLDDDDDPNRHPHLLDRPKPAGEKIAVTATCASGETKLLQITRADDLESLFKAARSKFKAMKRAPNTARLHAPPGPTLSDTASLAPGAVVFVDFDKEKEATRRTKKRAKEKAAEDETNAEKAEDVAGDASRAVDLVVAPARRGGADETTTDGAAERRAPRPPPASFAREGGKNPETPGPGPEAVAAENARLLAAVTRRRAFERDGATRDASNPRDVVELPAHRARDAIVRAVEASSSPVTVLTGETGSGKTTCVPLFVLEHYAAKGFGADANIVVAQPRRVAAISVARRVAEMFGEPVGETVGYAVRGESRMCRRRTRVVFVTTGALLARLATNPDLDGVSHVFVDEIHERTADADFLLAHLRDLLVRRWFPEPSRARPGLSDADVPERGEDGNGKLRVVLMSATMASSALRDYFASAFPPTAPVIPTPRVEGRAFPVEERFADAYARASPRDARAGEKKKDGGCSRRERARPRDDAFEAYSRALVASLPPVLAELETIGSGSGASGAGLVFLPGAPEIVRLERVLRDSLPGALRSRLHVVPLHGQLSSAEQQRAFDPAPAGKIKLVLATNVAETSLTIPDVVAVFDSGRSKKLAFDPRTRLSSLKEGWCSLASAAQRKGRAGRVRPGVCVRLYTAAESASNQPATDPPELQTTPLESLVMHAMLVSPERDPETTLAATPDPPPPESVRAATRRLRAVGAAEDAEDAADAENAVDYQYEAEGFDPDQKRRERAEAAAEAKASAEKKKKASNSAEKVAATGKKNRSKKRRGASGASATSRGVTYDVYESANALHVSKTPSPPMLYPSPPPPEPPDYSDVYEAATLAMTDGVGVRSSGDAQMKLIANEILLMENEIGVNKFNHLFEAYSQPALASERGEKTDVSAEEKKAKRAKRGEEPKAKSTEASASSSRRKKPRRAGVKV